MLSSPQRDDSRLRMSDMLFSRYVVGGVAAVILVLLIVLPGSSSGGVAGQVNSPLRGTSDRADFISDDQYQAAQRGEFKVAIVADLDKKSKVKDSKKPAWRSVLKMGMLKRDADSGTFSIAWDHDVPLSTKHGEAGRGMELSTLINYNGELLSADDRTGLLFHIDPASGKSWPKLIVPEGDGKTDKGFKIEWTSVKDGHLYLGSFGKEYTKPDGSIRNTNNNWVAIVDSEGRIRREDWTEAYNLLREKTGTSYPNGYIVHEAINWSPHTRSWVFLPRRVSQEAYTEEKDEKKGSNKVLIMDESMNEVSVKTVTPLTPERGFSAFRFLPGTSDRVVVALKSVENEEQGTQSTFITVFELDTTKVLMEETEVPGGMKFEGLEFVQW